MYCILKNDKTKPLHAKIEVIRSPDIGQKMQHAKFIAEDVIRDLAFFEIEKPRSYLSLSLLKSKLDSGTNIGSLGFPLAKPSVINNNLNFSIVERFQGAHI
jgi:hypothetical protein